MRMLATSYVCARYHHPERPPLETATVDVFAEYVQHRMADHVRGLLVRDAQGAIVSRPAWAQDLMNFGKDFATALREARRSAAC